MADLFGDEASEEAPSLFGGTTPAVSKSAEEEAISLPHLTPTNVVPIEPPKPTQEAPKKEAHPEKKEPKQKLVKKVIPKQQPSAPAPIQIDYIKRAINNLQTEIGQKFSELEDVVKEIQSISQPVKGATHNSDKTLREIQNLVTQSDEKDRQLREKQNIIASLGAALEETEERAQLRKKISQMTEEIAAETARFNDAQSDYDFLENQIERLKTELENKKNLREEKTKQVRAQSEYGLLEKKQAIERLRKIQNEKVKQWEEEKQILIEQIPQMKAATEQLRQEKQSVPQQEQQLVQARNAIKNELRNTIQKMVAEVFKMLGQNIDQEEDYTGQQVVGAVKKSLSIVADNILGGDDDEYEEDDDE